MIRRTSPMPVASARPGFTLLEVIVSTAITAILAASVFACLRVAFRARDSAMAAVRPTQAAEVALSIMRSDLESAMCPRERTIGPFIGTYDTVSFYAPVEPTIGPSHGEMKLIEYGVAPSTNALGQPDLVLVRRIQGNLLANPAPPAYEEIICRNIRTFQLSYFDGTQQLRGDAELEAWDSSQYDNSVPQAVRIVLELAVNEAGEPPAPGEEPVIRTTIRVFTLPCAKPVDVDELLGLEDD